MNNSAKGSNGSSPGMSRGIEGNIDKLAAMAHQAVDKATDAAAPTAEWLSEHGESLKAKQEKLMAETCSYVSANPLKAVGIALVTGFLLSRVLL